MLNRCYLKKLTISKMCKRPRGVQYITRAVCLSTTDVDLRQLDYWGRKRKKKRKEKEKRKKESKDVEKIDKDKLKRITIELDRELESRVESPIEFKHDGRIGEIATMERSRITHDCGAGRG